MGEKGKLSRTLRDGRNIEEDVTDGRKIRHLRRGIVKFEIVF